MQPPRSPRNGVVCIPTVMVHKFIVILFLIAIKNYLDKSSFAILPGIKNSLSTPSRLGISTEDFSKALEPPSTTAASSSKEAAVPPPREENLLGGAAAEFEGVEGLSPPKSSRITGIASAAHGDGVFATPTGTPCGTPQKPKSSVARGQVAVHGSISSLASATRCDDSFFLFCFYCPLVLDAWAWFHPPLPDLSRPHFDISFLLLRLFVFFS